MAINPNTDFTAGAVLTAAQQNRFPRGVMAYTTSTTTSGSITTEAVQITGSSFTAVANRYYKVTYFESGLTGTNTDANARLRLTNISGTVLALQAVAVPSTGGGFVHLAYVGTFTAGTTNVVATISGSAAVVANRSATRPSFLLVEDIGPA